MIEINLIPTELKAKSKKDAAIGPNQLLYLIPLIFGLLLLIHIGLVTVTISKTIQRSILAQKWQKLEAQRKALADLKNEFDLSSADTKTIRQLSAQNLSWAKRLNRLSLDLPSGVWFNELLVTPQDFLLRASVISLAKEEMALINKFIEGLKNDAEFFSGFSSLELGQIQRKVIGGYDIIDFELAGKFKSK